VAFVEGSGASFGGFTGFFVLSLPVTEFTLLMRSDLLTPPVIRSLRILLS